VTRAWLLVLIVGATSVTLKAAGPVLMGSRSPGWLLRLGRRMAPAVFAALVITSTVSSGREIVLDARLGGLAAALLAVWLRANSGVVLLAAIGTTLILSHLV
jgi:branched-subunit amino acid transport protein AzlD